MILLKRTTAQNPRPLEEDQKKSNKKTFKNHCPICRPPPPKKKKKIQEPPIPKPKKHHTKRQLRIGSEAKAAHGAGGLQRIPHVGEAEDVETWLMVAAKKTSGVVDMVESGWFVFFAVWVWLMSV